MVSIFRFYQAESKQTIYEIHTDEFQITSSEYIKTSFSWNLERAHCHSRNSTKTRQCKQLQFHILYKENPTIPFDCMHWLYVWTDDSFRFNSIWCKGLEIEWVFMKIRTKTDFKKSLFDWILFIFWQEFYWIKNKWNIFWSLNGYGWQFIRFNGTE